MFWSVETGGRFTYEDGGGVHKIPAAVDVPLDLLVSVLRDIYLFAEWVEAPAMPLGVLVSLRDAYCRQQGLPVDPEDLEHLLASLRRFESALEVDLQERGLDLLTEIRRRRWRKLLNMIDHLPYSSHYRQEMLNDEEFARAIMERQAKQNTPTRAGIPVREYTQEVDLLRTLIVAVRALQATVSGALGGKPGHIEPPPGPITLLKQMENDVRRTAHESLVARVLPQKAPPASG